MANVVLTTVEANQSEARTQSLDAVAKMAFASDVVVQVSRQLLKTRGRSPSTDPRKVDKGKAASLQETQQKSQLGNS